MRNWIANNTCSEMKLIKVKIDTGERPNGICGEGEESIKNLLSERQHRKIIKAGIPVSIKRCIGMIAKCLDSK